MVLKGVAAKRIIPSGESDKVLSQVLADRVKAARAQKFPSASSLLDNLGNTKVVFK